MKKQQQKVTKKSMSLEADAICLVTMQCDTISAAP